MIKKIAVSVVALTVLSSTAFATSTLSETASPAASILEGHGNPGDTATSKSDPDVSVRVLENGKVERTNSRYGSIRRQNICGASAADRGGADRHARSPVDAERALQLQVGSRRFRANECVIV